ncbi:DUF6361 family protein [Microbacterium aoyamense]|uniref:DUF6361 family protein n=1 Tax=Microbacterium aoyamense TaxID=344166 RepID=A0ABN2Q2I9_9MICO|nr:DUF6361 family protein [Microbacterium aoyamense]
MPSLIAWLDASSEEQRRMRDIIRLFAERESRDELGLGQIRDGIADALFPGTSTLLTRARYLLFVPWAYRKAAGRKDATGDAAQFERDTIRALKDAGDYAGLLGMQAGEALKNLPSAIYWTMLRHYGILSDASLTRDDALRLEGMRAAPDDLSEHKRFRAWSTTLPDAPDGFPKSLPGGFALQRDEAEWLRDRILDQAPDTLIAHLAVERPDRESPAPWADAAAIAVSGDAHVMLDDARAFSSLMHGAQLLYNLMLAEEYEAAGYEKLAEPTAGFRDRLDRWSDELIDLRSWDLDLLLARVELTRGSPINPQSRRFVRNWRDLLIEHGSAIADSAELRDFMARRERQHKGAQARLGNRARLATWGGSSGAGALVFRWPQVRGILLDIHDGLARRDGVTDA